MTNCEICGFHLEDASKPCPNCERIKKKKTIPTKSYTEAELATMPICETCGNHYEDTKENQKVCPNCRDIRMQDSVSRRPGAKTAEERAVDRKESVLETPMEQAVLKDTEKFKSFIPVAIAIVAVVIAVGAFVFMGG